MKTVSLFTGKVHDSSVQSVKANNFRNSLVTTIDQTGIKTIDSLSFSFLPASVYSYNIGDITLKMRNSN